MGSFENGRETRATLRDLRSRRFVLLLLAPLLMLVLSLASARPSVAAGEWRGTETGEDGVRRVRNPATPLEGQREIVLRELWKHGELTEDDEEGEIFGIIGSVFRDGEGNFYLLDTQLSEVRVYSPEGEFLHAMGRPGEGPGEFQNAADACLLSDGRVAVVQVFPGKAILFNRDGTPAGELPLLLGEDPSAQTFMAVPEIETVGSLVGASCINQVFTQQSFTQHYILGLFDLSGKLQVRVLEFVVDVDMSQGYPFHEAEAARFSRRWAAAADGTIYTPVAFHGYEIHVFDPAGKPTMVIEREYEPVVRTAAERQRVEDVFAGYVRTAPNARVFVEDTHSDIEEMRVMPDGSLWVLTSQGRWRTPEGVLASFDVFDPQGRFIEQVTLRGAGDARDDDLYLLGDRLVVIGNLRSAVVAAIGGDSEGGEEGDEPFLEAGVTVTCYGM